MSAHDPACTTNARLHKSVDSNLDTYLGEEEIDYEEVAHKHTAPDDIVPPLYLLESNGIDLDASYLVSSHQTKLNTRRTYVAGKDVGEGIRCLFQDECLVPQTVGRDLSVIRILCSAGHFVKDTKQEDHGDTRVAEVGIPETT